MFDNYKDVIAYKTDEDFEKFFQDCETYFQHWYGLHIIEKGRALEILLRKYSVHDIAEKLFISCKYIGECITYSHLPNEYIGYTRKEIIDRQLRGLKLNKICIENLEKQIDELKEKYKELEEEYSELDTAHDELQNHYNNLEKENYEFFKKFKYDLIMNRTVKLLDYNSEELKFNIISNLEKVRILDVENLLSLNDKDFSHDMIGILKSVNNKGFLEGFIPKSGFIVKRRGKVNPNV